MDNLIITHATSEEISKLFQHNENPRLQLMVRPNEIGSTYVVTITGNNWKQIQALLNKVN